MWAVFFRTNPFKQTEFFDDEAKARERCDRLQDTGLAPELMMTAPPHTMAAWPPPNAPTTAEVLAWAVDMFGPVATNREERAARLLEEALEVAQCEGLDIVTAGNIARRVYARPRGELTQEIGGVAITLAALAENAGRDLTTCVEREWTRVKSKPREWWTAKHAEKVKDGTANVNADSPRVYSGLIRENVWEYGTIEARAASVVDAQLKHGVQTAAEAQTSLADVTLPTAGPALTIIDNGVPGDATWTDALAVLNHHQWGLGSIADAFTPGMDNGAPGEICVGFTWSRCEHGVPAYSVCPECEHASR